MRLLADKRRQDVPEGRIIEVHEPCWKWTQMENAGALLLQPQTQGVSRIQFRLCHRAKALEGRTLFGVCPERRLPDVLEQGPALASDALLQPILRGGIH